MKVEWVPLDAVLVMERTPIALVPGETYERIGIFSWGKGMLRRDPASVAGMGSMKYFSFPTPSLIFSNIQAWEGAVALADNEDAGYVCSSRFYPYVPKKGANVNLGYLLEFFRSEDGLALMRRASPGTQVRNKVLNRAALEGSRIPLPSSSDQDRIADHLSALGRTGRTVGPSMDSLQETLIARAGSGVRRVPIRELMSSTRQWIQIDDGGVYRAIGVRGFGRGMIRYPEAPAAELSKLRYYPLEPGGLIVSNIKAWEGAVCMAENADAGRIASNRFLQYVPTSDAITTAWVEQYLLSTEGIASMSAASPGSADRNRTLSMAAFEAIEIPVPEPRVQHALVSVAHARRRVQAQQVHRDHLAAAILPAARNEIFSAMR